MKSGSWKNVVNLTGLILAWILIVFLIIHLFTGKSGVPSNRDLKQKLSSMEKENQRLMRENKMLLDQIYYRRSSAYLEELARTELRHVKQGEIMILLPTPASTESSINSLDSESF